MIRKTTEEVKANVCKNRCLGSVTASGKGAWEAVGVLKDNGVGFPSGKSYKIYCSNDVQSHKCIKPHRTAHFK